MTDDTYGVGYGKPPKHSQFRPGESGNPQGRPKGALNMNSVLKRILREKISVRENGKRKTLTKLDAAVLQAANRAVKGDLKAFQLLATLVRFAEDRVIEEDRPNLISDEVDKRVLFSILQRLESAEKEDTKNADKGISE